MNSLLLSCFLSLLIECGTCPPGINSENELKVRARNGLDSGSQTRLRKEEKVK